MLQRGMKPAHPGSLIKESLNGLKEEGIKLTSADIADALGVTRKTLSAIINKKQGISPEMAVRLSEALNTSPQFWLNVQRNYDLWFAEKKVKRDKIKHLWECNLVPA